jgi:hypothetical protein
VILPPLVFPAESNNFNCLLDFCNKNTQLVINNMIALWYKLFIDVKMEAEVLEFPLSHQYIVNDVDAMKSSS